MVTEESSFSTKNGINTLTKDIIIENSNPSYPVDPDILPNHCVGYFAGDIVIIQKQVTILQRLIFKYSWLKTNK
jgi:hypothetical protein